jgi:hypothetical protein
LYNRSQSPDTAAIRLVQGFIRPGMLGHIEQVRIPPANMYGTVYNTA